ncbi:MAG: hypothetical protein GXO62_02440 [Epsilonproteobacteria bacterium]|nr:hypothetical protein [Campylobacterota bacterium]
MKVRVYSATGAILIQTLEKIYKQFRDDSFLDEYDFIIFSVSDSYDERDVNYSIKKVFNTNNYIAFDAIKAFCNDQIVQGVVALFIKFEKNAKVTVHKTKDFHNFKAKKDDLLITYMPNQEGKCHCQALEKSHKVLLGGIASGRGRLYCNDEILKDENLVLQFENLEHQFGIALGYKPVGPTYQVQISHETKVYVIDYEDASVIAERLLKNTDHNIQNLWYSPVLITSKRGYTDVARTFKNIKPNSYVEFFGKIEVGDTIKLSFATEDMLLKEDEKTAKEVKDKITHPELVFNFSCVAREYVLGEKQGDEPFIYSKIFNAPLFGFFTYGEIGPSYNLRSSILYNQTSVIVALKEK